MDTAFNLIFNIEQFADDCKLWNRYPEVDKTCGNFKIYFSLLHKEIRENPATAATSGFGAANAAYVREQTTDALMNLAPATESDRRTVSELSAMNKKITTELIKTNQLLTLALTEVVALKTQLTAGGGLVNTPATGPPRSQRIPKCVVRLNNNINYC